jgi:putative ABC transport system permease protein
MMRPGLYLRSLVRESRGARGRLAFFAACLSVGVAAVVAVAGLADGLDSGIRSEARKLMAADLVIRGRRPLPDEVESFLAGRGGLDIARVKQLATLVAAPSSGDLPGASLLVQLKAIEGGYPFYGELRLDPDRPVSELLGADQAVLAAPELLRRLDLDTGDTLLVGGHPFRIAGQVLAEPDRVGLGPAMGPRLMISAAGLARTDLERFGSRINRRTLLRLDGDPSAEELAGLRNEIAALLGEDGAWSVESYADALPTLRQGLERMERYLGLVALLSLLLGGLGVAQTTRAWLADRMPAVAVMRCLGMRPREVVALHLITAAALGLAGSLVGAAAGLGVLALMPSLLVDLVPAELLRVWQPLAVARGLALGLTVALLFCIGPLDAVRRVPPLRVLRRDVEPVLPPVWLRILLLAVVTAGITLTAVAQSGSLRDGALFTLSLFIAGGVLSLLTLGATLAAGKLGAGARPVWLRHGLKALGRPGAGTLGAAVALGIGVLLVLGVRLVERGLSDELRAELPAEAPTAFFIDIQPDQWPPVRRLLLEQGAEELDSVPVVTARLTAIDDTPIEELAAIEGTRDRRWALTREQRLTYQERLPDDNRVVAGTLWGDPGLAEISVEEEFAAEIGAGLGSRLDFDIQGVPLELTVTSLRAVEWRTFGINFFLVVEPGVLDEAPHYRLATAQLPADREAAIQDRLAAEHPNVLLLRIREVLEKVAAIFARLAAAVSWLGGFTVAAGAVILAGAVSATATRRGREIALLKTLGMTRLQVVGRFAVEYAVVGVIAGIVGAAGANVLAWAVLTRGFEMSWGLRPETTAVAILLSVALTAATAIAAGWGALQRRPLEALKAE